MTRLKETIGSLTKRWQRKLSPWTCVRSGLKGLITITLICWMGYLFDLSMIMAPFAASCITVFTTPRDPFAQPMNIVFGYLTAALIGLIMVNLLPHEWWFAGISLAVTISAMAFLRVTHPPAGSVPLILFYYKENATWDFLLFPTLTGSLIIVVSAIVLHNIPLPRIREYPRKTDSEPTRR